MSYENLTRRIERSTREAEGRFYRYDRNHPNTQLGRDSRFPIGTNLPESNLRRPYQTILTGAGIAAGAAGMAGCAGKSTSKKEALQNRLDQILNNVKERIGEADAREAIQLQEQIVEMNKHERQSAFTRDTYYFTRLHGVDVPEPAYMLNDDGSVRELNNWDKASYLFDVSFPFALLGATLIGAPYLLWRLREKGDGRGAKNKLIKGGQK